MQPQDCAAPLDSVGDFGDIHRRGASVASQQAKDMTQQCRRGLVSDQPDCALEVANADVVDNEPGPTRLVGRELCRRAERGLH